MWIHESDLQGRVEQGKRLLCRRFGIGGNSEKSGRVRASGNTLAAVLAAFLLTGISVSSVSAALDGVNTFVEPGNQNIKIGNGTDLRNNSTKNGAIAIGDHAQIDDYVMQEGSIAIGKNAFVENMWGTQDKIFRFGMHSTDPLRTDHLLPAGIAIGQNTYARSGVMIGDHKYVGALGDTTVNSNTDNEKRKLSVLVGATTVGLNSYSAGAFATTTGAYSIMTNAYDGDTNQGSAAQNFGAVINGSFNSIESKTAGSSVSGIANAVVGTANRTHNANGTLVFGAGNEVTNSVDNIADPMSLLTNSPKELAEKLRENIRRNDSGGAVLAVGGGNKADYAYRSQLIGVGNTLKGTAAQKASYNLLNGYRNTGTNAEHLSVIGSDNTVENSKSQTVIGDSNKIIDRNAGTVSGKQEERTKNVSDLVIGKGNKIEGNSTYMKGYESLTVIGNNNEMVNPGAGIVIGDNQKVGAIRESVVIGSMTPEEKADSDIQQKHASVVVGYHAQSGTRDGGGMNVALGHGAKAYGWQETVTGIKSIVEAGDSGYDGYLASVYGGLNTVASNKADQNDGMANTVVGTLNKTEGANGALVFGAGNSVTHSFGTAPTDEDGNSMNEYWGDAILDGQGYVGGTGRLSHDELRKAMGLAMATGGGSVVTMGNGNTSDYAVHSQIIGSGNILTGTGNTPSINNTINGYANTGKNVERMSMMGTGNNISGSTADVVIGDYHHMDGGKNNVILGSMATEKKTVEKTYTMKDASGNVILEKKYKVMENVPIKSHTANISNAVMLGYNTDVEKDGGVALGADSVASIDKGVAGFDPSADTASADTSATWKSTAAAVSVGKAATPTSAAVTRQITNVAAGKEDTDAVNVAQLKAVKSAAAAAKTHYYSAKSTKTGAGSNYDNDGAKAEDSIVLGISSSSDGVNSTVLGNNNKLTGVKNGRNNSIVAGQNLEVEGVHNAVFGTDYNNYDHKLTKVFGEQNTVLGVGNLVGYTAEQDPNDPTKWIYTKKGSGSDQNVAVGLTNTANGGSVVVGTSSEAENLGTSVGHGNKVIGSNNGGGQWGLALGNYLTVKGEEAVAVGKEASATAGWAIAMGSKSSAEKETAMAFGYDSHAKVSGGVALGSWSVADTEKGKVGYDISGTDHSNDTTGVWKSTAAAVSVGKEATPTSTAVTRQITNVAAGAADTDAVNVAQLKKAVAGAADGNDTLVSGSNGLSLSGKTLSMSVKDTAGNEVKGSVDLSSVADGNDKLVSDNNALSLTGKTLSMSVKDTAGNEVKGSVDLSAIAGQIDTNTTYTMSGTENADNTTTISLKGSDGKENKVTVATKDTRNTVKAGENVTLDTAANTSGGTEYTVNVKADGKVEDGSAKIVSGNTVYHETHVKNDGNYVKKENSAGDNLTILDKQVGNNTTNITNLGNTINNLNGKLGTLDNRINKVGAGAAALAALHPLDFNPDDKWDFAVGYGNYKDAHAVAVGAFYRPNEDTMFSVGGSLGGGENMVNAGLSVKLGQGNGVSTSKVAMAKEIVDLKADNKELRKQVEEMNDRLNAVLGLLDAGKTRDFPDVPENHWAYEYIRVLAGNGLIQGYPDGTFGGDRSMTRYEFAALLYRALKNGAPVDDTMDRAMNEFEPELRQIRADRIRVDRVSGKDNDRNKVERVHINNDDNKDNNDYRDVYGSRISAEMK